MSFSSIRFAPPLVIEEVDLRKSIQIIADSLKDLDEVRTYMGSIIVLRSLSILA